MTEAELLFSEILGCHRQDLYLNNQRVLSADEFSRISQAFRRRACGEPLAYILGKTEFMGLEFKVSPHVLIPRPETEILVEKTIELMMRNEQGVMRQNILDLGTGSGCIAIALAKRFPQAKITAVDISEEALQVAKENAASHKVEINFIHSDLFPPYSLALNPYSLIISNPPYIPSPDIINLQREVQCEPRVALNGGSDGLDFYRRIISQSPGYLEDGGMLALEIGFGQKDSVERIFTSSGKFDILEIVKDYSHIDRIITARKR